MANYPNYNLYGKRPADTFRNIVQFNITASNLVDSYGDELSLINITASNFGTSSWAAKAVSASWAPDQTVTVISASWASQSLSASWAPFTDTGTVLYTASAYPITSSWATQSINSLNASWATQSLTSLTTTQSLFSDSASWASQSLNTEWATSSFNAYSAGTATQSLSSYTATSSLNAVWATSSLTANTTTSSLSASWVNTLNQEVDIEGPLGQGNTSAKTSLLVVGREGWPARIVQGGLFVTQSARPVLYVYRDLTQSQAQTTPLLQLRTLETGSLAPLMVASNDVSDVFTVDYSGSITASGLFGTASWANKSVSALSTSFVYPLYQEVEMFGPTNVGDTTPYTSLKVVGREGWPARIVQGGSFVTQSARPVLYVYRDLDQSQAQLTPLLQLRTLETGSIAPLMIASNDVSDVFKIDYSGSITASGLFGTASNAVSASWAPTSITYPLTVLTVNEVSYSINFLAGQYFQLDTTGSEFTFGNSTNVVAVRNASVYITAQSGSRTVVFNPSWIVMGNFPTTIAHNSASILSLTTFGSNDASVVAAFTSKV